MALLDVLAAMGAGKVKQGTDGDNASGVDVVVGNVVVAFNVVEVDGFGDARLLVKIAEIALEVGIIDDPAEVAFEMTVINGVETDEGTKETPIGFDDLRAKQKSARREALFQMVESCEEGAASLLVDNLTRGKAGFINAVVDVFVDEVGKLSLCGCNILWKELRSSGGC